MQERKIFAHTYICWLAMSAISASLCPRLGMHISHPFSERILSTLVGITHYFSSYVPSFRVWAKPAALYLHGSVDLGLYPCPTLSAFGSKWVFVLSERLRTALMNWDPAIFTSAQSSSTPRISLCNAHVTQGIIKTRHRTMQVRRGLGISACSSDKYCRHKVPSSDSSS